MKQRYTKLLMITIAYFLGGFIHIGLSLAMLICLALPFILVLRSGSKTWCASYCPRSYWLDLSGKIGRNRRAPNWLMAPRMRKIVLIYFGLNFFFITMSSIMVGLGRVEPMDIIRFFILIPTNWRLPQLLDFGPLPPVLLHLSYRMYSVMLSSTLAGTVLAILYKPRTWCAICPINTMSNGLVNKINENKKKTIVIEEN